MRQLAIPFAERLHRFEAGGSQEKFRTFSPTGKVPALLDDSVVVWDSLAIAEYLFEKHTDVWPEDRLARAWARSASAEMHSGFANLRQQCSFNAGLRVRLHSIGENLRQDLSRLEELWGEGLSRFGGPFLAGQKFSAVDAFYAPIAFRVQTYGLDLGEPAQSYVYALLALKSMQQWYHSGLAEEFRDAAHDAIVRAYGEILEDLRVPETSTVRIG